MRISTIALTLLGPLAVVIPFACGGSGELQNHSYSPPTGVGGFDPGDGGFGTGTGMGAGNPQGSSSGTGGGGPPMCDDSLKRCDHVFTYPVGPETTVEVRGDFASDGWTSGVPMTKSGSTWSATVPVPWNTDVLYKFLINGTMWIADPGNPDQVPDGFGAFNSKLTGGTCATWSCAAPLMGTFDWRDAVLYFAFVDRFLDGNPANNGAQVPSVAPAANYQGGDYAGVTKKIQDGYFTDLGINVLWLTVPMDNPEVSGIGTDGKLYSAYHGYWPQNLDQTEERFGAMAELKGLVDAAHLVNIKVILDYAMNHVHQSSPVYAQHPDWFWPLLFNGQSCVCGAPACQWDSAQAKRCWFADYLPDFNFTVAAARQFSVDNAISWAKNTGADGFRLDAVKHIEDAWITDLRARVKTDIEATTKEHFYMVGETFTGDQNLIKYYVDPVNKLDGQFDFPLRQRLLTSVLMRSTPMTDLEGFMNGNDGFYGSGIMSTFFGNHDVPRSIHFAEDAPLWGDPWSDGKDRNWSNQPGLTAGTKAFERMANAFTILLTTKGVPLIYYGDEVGMPGAGDPDNRRMMQWSGYSAGQSLLLGRVKKLTAIRAAHPALRRGGRSTVWVNADTYAYKMTSGSDLVYVAVNRSDSAQSIGNLPSGSHQDLIGGGMVTGPTVTVPPRSSMVFAGP
jgi:glycosidase